MQRKGRKQRRIRQASKLQMRLYSTLFLLLQLFTFSTPNLLSSSSSLVGHETPVPIISSEDHAITSNVKDLTSKESPPEKERHRQFFLRHNSSTDKDAEGETTTAEAEEGSLEEIAWPVFSRKIDDTHRRSSTFYKTLKHFNLARRLKSEEDTETHDGDGEEAHDDAHDLVIHVDFQDIYDTLVFLTAAYVAGKIAAFLGMPSLVGEIVAGFLLGPPLADYVPFPEAMVLFGEIGLIMLLLEAGIEIDVGQLKETGKRAVAMAVTGSLLPLFVGFGLSMASGEDWKGAIAAGACFSPTSLGVANNALSAGDMLNTPVGQLIVAACVVDDVIGLVILSMLEVLVNEDPELYEYFIPIISAFGYLIVLGYSALTWMPHFIENRILPRFPESWREYVAFALMLALLMGYLPALHYSKASYLTGAFLAGLTFSQIHSVHATFVTETRSIMAWLLRIFFSASIGFQVPIKYFDRGYVLGWGFLFYIAILAKIPLGLFVPKFQKTVPDDHPFNPYSRDVIITGVGMTCRGEFSFIIASFALTNKLFDAEFYAAIIFTVLLSCVTSPFILLLVIRHYNNLSKQYLKKIEEPKMLEGDKLPLYLSIQIRSGLIWGLQESIMKECGELGLYIIDHRSWHPRGLDATVVTEIYAYDSNVHIPTSYSKEWNDEPTEQSLKIDAYESIPVEGSSIKASSGDVNGDSLGDKIVSKRCDEIRVALGACIGLDDTKVRVLRWIPTNFATEAEEISTHPFEQQSYAQKESILAEARSKLHTNEMIDTSVDEVPKPRRIRIQSGPLTSICIGEGDLMADDLEGSEDVRFVPAGGARPTRHTTGEIPSGGQPRPSLRRRSSSRRRTKQMSTPVVSGSNLWDDDAEVRQASRRNIFVPAMQDDLNTGPTYGVARRKKTPSDLTTIMENAPTIEERLGGLVRQETPARPFMPTIQQSQHSDMST